MASLTGTKIKDTYDSLLKVSDNGGLGASAKQLTDGLGTASPLYLSTTQMGIGATPDASVKLHVQGEIGTTNGTAAAPTHTFYGDSNTGMYRAAADTLGFSTVGTERMRIDNSGNVGIGISPSAVGNYKVLSLNGSGGSGAYMQLNSDSSIQAEIYSNSSELSFYAYGARIQTFWTNGSEAMRIDSSGNVTMYNNLYCSNIITNSGDLSIDSGGSGNNILFKYNGTERMRITSGGDLLMDCTANPDGITNFGSAFINISQDRMALLMATSATTSQTLISFFNPNGNVGSIATSGSSTAYNTSSDYRLKEDWQPMEGALTRIDALKPVNFAWKADGSRVDGFLAHELALVVPEAVTGEKDATEEYEVTPAEYKTVVVTPAQEAVYETIEHPAIAEELDADGNIIVEAQEAWTEQVLVSEAVEEVTEQVLVSEAVMGTRPVYQGIDQSKIVPLLVAAIQELRAEVEALKGA